MGRRKSIGEVGLAQVISQSALFVKNPLEQSKAQTQPKHRPCRAPRANNRGDEPVVENDNHPISHKLDCDKELWEKTSTHAGTQKGNHLFHHGGGGPDERGATQSEPRSPAEPSDVQTQACRPRLSCRRAQRKSYIKWKKKRAAVEDPPFPLLCKQQPLETEDWEQEISEQAGGWPCGIEDDLALAMALTKLSVEQASSRSMPMLYNPSVHHKPPVKWEYSCHPTVEGQFSDAEE